MSERALLIAIAIIACTLVALSLVIVVLKAIREARQAHRRRWRRSLEPGLQRYVTTSEAASPGAVAPVPPPSLARFAQVPSRGAGREAAIDFLLEHSEIVKGESLERITAGLEELGHVDEEIARLESRSWWHRASAADRLGLSRSPRAIEALTVHLDDADEDVRLRVARALGMIGGQAAIHPLVVALAQPSRWSTLRVAEILANMSPGGPRVEAELVRAWPGMPRVSRLATLDILGRLRIPSSAAFLQDRLVDEDPDIRARAAHALGQIGDPTVYRGLIQAMRDPQWPVRAMSAKALGRLRAPEAIEALAGGLQDRQWWVRSNSAEALRDLGDRGVRALLAALEVPDPFARHQAILMLEQTGLIDKWAADLPGSGAEAETARAGLKRLIELGQTGRLEDLALTHADPSARAAVAGLLPTLPRGPLGSRPAGSRT